MLFKEQLVMSWSPQHGHENGTAKLWTWGLAEHHMWCPSPLDGTTVIFLFLLRRMLRPCGSGVRVVGSWDEVQFIFHPLKSLDTKDALRAWDPPGVLVLDIAHRQFMPFRLSRCLIQESKRADNYFPIWAGLNPQCLSRCKCHTHQRPIFVHAHLRLSDITIACLETFMHGVPESSECIRTPEIA